MGSKYDIYLGGGANPAFLKTIIDSALEEFLDYFAWENRLHARFMGGDLTICDSSLSSLISYRQRYGVDFPFCLAVYWDKENYESFAEASAAIVRTLLELTDWDLLVLDNTDTVLLRKAGQIVVHHDPDYLSGAIMALVAKLDVTYQDLNRG